MTESKVKGKKAVMRDSRPKTPKTAIVYAHALTDELLALWQESIRPWHREDGETNPDGPATYQIDDAIVGALTVCRELRVLVERKP